MAAGPDPAGRRRVLPSLVQRAPDPGRDGRPHHLARADLPRLDPAVTADTVAEPVQTRVCAVLVHDGRVCLIRRQRSAGDQHSLPGGVVEEEDGKDRVDALRRELLEELGLDLAVLPAPPVLRFVQDQETERPGEAEPFRRRHLVYVAHLPDHLAAAVAAVEQDVPDEAPVVWLPVADTAAPHLYPDVGAVLGQAAWPDGTAGGPLLLPAMTTTSYRWR
ncbi:NUDIX domain-containing protein [Kitasatospora fiedleri]|uniref:NUDIX domain-containing protein n=1 Tax=Kitasatospora fiedleri TaxID=2991545 RepID=UPI00249B0985|nr:NUDIX domain-containing protein [Kitasatospora fiedleri]